MYTKCTYLIKQYTLIIRIPFSKENKRVHVIYGLYLSNAMKNKTTKYHNIGTVPATNQYIVETETKSIRYIFKRRFLYLTLFLATH